jgi:capsular polysaccharide biosynthesis protein
MTESAKRQISEEKPDNPAYIRLMTQIKAAKNEIKEIQEDKQIISRSIQDYQKIIEKTPIVEKELNALTRDYAAAKDKYNEVWNELSAAQVAAKVESKQGSQRFNIESPAYLPNDPYKPNRLAIIMVSFLIAIGLGTTIQAFKESLDNTIKSSDQLIKITNVPVLSSVHYVTTDSEKRMKRFKIVVWILLVVSLIIISIHFASQYVSFEELWGIILERIKMIA